MTSIFLHGHQPSLSEDASQHPAGFNKRYCGRFAPGVAARPVFDNRLPGATRCRRRRNLPLRLEPFPLRCYGSDGFRTCRPVRSMFVLPSFPRTILAVPMLKARAEARHRLCAGRSTAAWRYRADTRDGPRVWAGVRGQASQDKIRRPDQSSHFIGQVHPAGRFLSIRSNG